MAAESLRAFARRVGVTPRAVRKAVENGRLERAVGRPSAGAPCIVDIHLALREWTDNADPARRRDDADDMCMSTVPSANMG